MGDKDSNTYIKLYRKIIDWRWFRDANTLQVFLWLLLSANIKPQEFLSTEIQRGEVATSYASIAGETGLTVDQVRTAMIHLKRTGEITVKRHSTFQQITIVKYEDYQGSNSKTVPIISQSNPNQIPISSQSFPNNQRNNKNVKNGKNNMGASPDSPPAKDEVIPQEWEKKIPSIFWGRFDSEDDWLIWDGQKEKDDV